MSLYAFGDVGSATSMHTRTKPVNRRARISRMANELELSQEGGREAGGG